MLPRILLCLLVPACLAPAQPLIETNFSAPYRFLPANDRVQGQLPAGWRDNSEFGRTWITYSHAEEPGRPFFRVDVTRVEDGWCQLIAPLSHFDAETYLRLSVSLRNPDDLMTGLGVRRLSAPYKYLWQVSRSFPAAWSDQQFYFRVPQSDFDIGVFLTVHGTGTVDLSRFRLEKVTLADMRRDLIHATRAGGPKNLVRISRFPLGLQSGFSLDRESSDGDEVRISPDPQTTGPSGAAALHIRSEKRMRLYTAPFTIADLAAGHTASLYFRGHGSGRLIALADLHQVAQQPFQLAGGDWQRIQVRFTPDLLARVHGVEIEGSGDFWIDALQVERGAQSTAYESPGECEVSLTVDSPARVQFDDEPAAVRYLVTGHTNGARLRAKVVNVYGDEHSLTPKDGTLNYNVFPNRPYGSFRIEAWVEDSSGRRISPYNELVVHRLHRPRYWMKDAPDSPFGTHILATTRAIQMAKAIGINWARLHDTGTSYIGWYHLERKPGEWTFQDESLQRYRKYGMKILGAFSTAPEWASYFEKPHEGYSDKFYQPRDLNAFANYVQVVAKRYQGVIDIYDLWNEPFNAGYWSVGYDEQKKAYIASKTGPADFARLQQTAWEALKSVAPAITLLGVQTSAGQSGARWTRGFAAAGGARYCDVMCYHQYTSDAPGYPGDTIEAGLRSAFEPLRDVTKPIWLTEGSNQSGRIGNGMYHYTLPYPEEEDVIDTSDRLSRYVVAALARGVQKVFLYSMHTHTWFGTGSTWRVLVTEEGYLHPSAAAHSAMAWFLEDTKIVKSVSPAEGVTSYVFQGAGRTVTVLSPQPKHAAYPLPVGGSDLFGNPLPKGALLGKNLVYLISHE